MSACGLLMYESCIDVVCNDSASAEAGASATIQAWQCRKMRW